MGSAYHHPPWRVSVRDTPFLMSLKPSCSWSLNRSQHSLREEDTRGLRDSVAGRGTHVVGESPPHKCWRARVVCSSPFIQRNRTQDEVGCKLLLTRVCSVHVRGGKGRKRREVRKEMLVWGLREGEGTRHTHLCLPLSAHAHTSLRPRLWSPCLWSYFPRQPKNNFHLT